MNVLSLFDGISTGRYCLDKAGIKVDNYYACEIENSAIKISAKNYPDIIRLGDVTKVSVRDLPKIDLLIGGSPCQGFSRAGKCLNFEDPRSKLFFEYVRLLEEIRAYNPDVKFLLENVAMKKEWEDVISSYLGVKPVKINSKYFSAQNRPREYWTNISILEYEKKGVDLIDILEDYTPDNMVEYNGILFDKGTSDAGRKLVNVVDGEVRISQAVTKGYIVAENGDGVSLEFPTSKSRRGRVIKKRSSTLTTAGKPQVFINGMVRLFTITERERLQTLPDGYTECEGVSEDSRGKALGNGWTAEVITHIFKGLTYGNS